MESFILLFVARDNNKSEILIDPLLSCQTRPNSARDDGQFCTDCWFSTALGLFVCLAKHLTNRAFSEKVRSHHLPMIRPAGRRVMVGPEAWIGGGGSSGLLVVKWNSTHLYLDAPTLCSKL